MGRQPIALSRRGVLALALAGGAWRASAAPALPPGVVRLPVPARVDSPRLARAPDGRLIVSAALRRQERFGAALFALQPDGRLDTSFGSGGEAFTAAVGRGGISSLIPQAMALQPDGRIVLAGECNTDEQYSSDFLVMRYLPDGRIDASFAEQGWTNTPIGSSHDMARAVVADPAGGIVAVGGSLQRQLVIAARYDFALVRYTADGRLDARFARNGKSVIRVGSVSEDFGYAAAVDGRRRVLVTGRTHTRAASDVALLRVREDGRLDAEFGAGGKVVTRFGDASAHGSAVAVQPDGKILVAASAAGGDGGAIVMRHGPDGRFDSTFGARGVVRLPAMRGAAALQLQADGRILVLGVGARTPEGWPRLVVARLLPGGQPDDSFGTDGMMAVSLGTGLTPSGLAVSPAGEVYACASGSERFERIEPGREPGVLLLKFTARGALDPGFGSAVR